MSRFSFTIQTRPKELQKAVEGLERKRRDWKEESLTFQGFINELPKISKDKLKKMKLRKSAQELLPYVLVEDNLDSSVLDALFVLIESKCSHFSSQTRNRILSYGLMYPQIRKIGYNYFQKNPPNETDSRWIFSYWKRIFRPEDPIANFMTIARENQVPIIMLADWFEMNPYVLWMDELMTVYVDQHNPETLRKCQFWDTYKFVRSSVPVHVRSMVLVWVLNSYVQNWTKWEEVPRPYQMLIEISLELWGEPYRRYWKECTSQVSTIGTWYSTIKNE